MILMFLFVQGLVDLLVNLVNLVLNHTIRQIRQITLDFHQLLHLLVEREQELWISRVSDRVHDHHHESLNFIHIPIVVIMTSHHRLEDNGNGLDRVSDHILAQKCIRVRMIIQELVTDPDEDPTVVNPSSSAGLSPPVEQRDCSRRQRRFRSRERTTQSKRKQAELGKPSGLLVAKKQMCMESDEDDEEPQNEPGTSSNLCTNAAFELRTSSQSHFTRTSCQRHL